MKINIGISKVILTLSLFCIAMLSIIAIATAASVVGKSDITLGLAWGTMIYEAYKADIFGILLGYLGYWGALAAIALAPPTGGASIAVAL